MRCAVSFLSVLVLLVGVGVSAFIIIWKTTPSKSGDGGCDKDNEFECHEETLCISKQRKCNGIPDCPWGSDEMPVECEDMQGAIDLLVRLMTNCGRQENRTESTSVNGTEGSQLQPNASLTSDNEEEISQLGFPEGCRKRHRGIFCGDTDINPMPWEQLDMTASGLTLANILHTRSLTVELTPPENNSISKVFIENNTLTSLEKSSICNWNKACWIHLTNNSIEEIDPDAFCDLPSLRWLDLSKNKLKLRGFRFQNLSKLQDLQLNYNEIDEITEDMFASLEELVSLQMNHNKIQFIHESGFRCNPKLKEILLEHNRIKRIQPETFLSQKILQKLVISYNPLESLPAEALSYLQNLEFLYLNEIDSSAFDMAAINGLQKLDYIYFKKFSYCRYVPKVSRCFPFADGISSRLNLLGGKTLRWIVWIVAALTLAGNSVVLICRCLLSNRGRILDVFINNLAVADMLMGIYLTVLAIKDIEYRNVYDSHVYEWSTSWLCSGIGILAMISSEVSLLILTITSVERYLVISGPFSYHQNLTLNLARLSMVIIWVFVAVLAVAPAIQYGKFSFYGSTGLCFPVHLDDPFTIGWQYTSFLFVGLNSACLIIVAVSYTTLFYVIRKTRMSTPVGAKDTEMAVKFFLMVFTNCVCWLPIIILKIYSFAGHEIPKEFISWVVVFVLPINSTINPYLYTLSMGEIRMNLLGRCIPTSTTRRSRNMISLYLWRLGANNTEDSRGTSWDTTNTTNTNVSRDIKHPSHRSRLSYHR